MIQFVKDFNFLEVWECYVFEEKKTFTTVQLLLYLNLFGLNAPFAFSTWLTSEVFVKSFSGDEVLERHKFLSAFRRNGMSCF